MIISKFVMLKVDTRTMLEFEESCFYSTFMPPENEGMSIISKNGRNVDSSSLHDLSARGREQPSLCTLDSSEDSHRVWSMDTSTCQAYIRTWSHQILEEQVSNLHDSTRHIDQSQKHTEKVWNRKTNSTLKSKSIIG